MTELSYLRPTRDFYDTIAHDYAELYKGNLDTLPLDRAMLGAFAERVLATGGGQVADLGCGPGEVTAFLDGRGLEVSGLDLSPEMVALARRTFPALRFEVGSMTGLAFADGSLAGVVAYYSIIHLPWERLPEVFAEFHRVLAPRGQLLVAFQAGEEPLRLERPFGHDVTIDFNRLSPDRVAGLLQQAGFAVDARLMRETDPSEQVSQVSQAFLLARRSS
ncbi:MAG: class I SAM-dependent methyltransferase [Nonomuraea sp.]|nr:class I SAM-dependent methyltransferase [Nonomuraea sp.]